MGEMSNAYGEMESLKGRDHLEGLGADGKVTLDGS
jgi:hypothetical protein